MYGFLERKKINLFMVTTLFPFLILNIFNNDLWAFNIELDPRLSWQLYYEDNIAGVSSEDRFGKISGFSNRYEPELNFNIQGSRIAVTGYTRAQVNRYVSEKEWDTTDKEYSIQSLIKLNFRSELNIGAGYSLNTNPERYFDQNAEVVGGFLVRKSTSITKAYDVGYTYKLSSRSTIIFLFNYLIFFTRASSGSPVYSYKLNYEYLLSNKDIMSLSLGYRNLKFNYAIAEELLNFKLDTYTINVGLTRQFNETLKLNLSAGWYSTETKSERAIFKEDPVTGEQILSGTESFSNTTPGSNFTFLLEKKYYHTTFIIRVSQSLYTNPETGQTYPTRNFGFTTRYDFTSKLQGLATYYFYKNEATAGDYNNRVSIETQSNYSVLQLLYRYKSNINIVLSYSRAESEDKFSNIETIRNNVWLQCIFELQRPYVAR